MRSNENLIIGVLTNLVLDMSQVLTYLLLMLYTVVLLFNGELNPNFPLQNENLLFGAVGFEVLRVLLIFWLHRKN